jgi:hypothetical protein
MGTYKNNGRLMGEHTYSHTNKNGDKGYGHTKQQAKDNSSKKSNKPFIWNPFS